MTSPAIEPLYRDDALVAVSKPPGILVHRSREASDRVFLLQELRRAIGQHLYPVHRLDRAASGVICFALSPEDARLLQAALSCPDARKEYLVLVRGSTPDHFESTRPLHAANGVSRPARSEFVKIAEFSRCSLLRARIHTGRRHQIRRHLAHCAHQVIGDTTYGKGKINRALRARHRLPRLFLHARTLEFRHPRSSRRLRLEAPLAEDLRAFLLRLPDCDDDQVRSL